MTENQPGGGHGVNQSPNNPKAQAKADKAYRKASRPWYKKKRFILPLILLAVIVLSMAFSGGGDEDGAGNAESGNVAPIEGEGQEEAPADEAPAEEAPAEEAEPAFPGAQDSDVIGQAGDELQIGDAAVTSSALTEGGSPEIAGPTLCTTVSLTNGSDETIDFHAFDWKLQEPGGTIMDAGFMGSDDILTGGQIAPGGSTSGDVCFDSEGAEPGTYVVLYEPIFSFFSDRAAWINER